MDYSWQDVLQQFHQHGWDHEVCGLVLRIQRQMYHHQKHFYIFQVCLLECLEVRKHSAGQASFLMSQREACVHYPIFHARETSMILPLPNTQRTQPWQSDRCQSLFKVFNCTSLFHLFEQNPIRSIWQIFNFVFF